MNNETRYVTGIDIGTKTVRVLQGRVERDGKIKIIGHAEMESGGMRKGVVSEVGAPMEIVEEALKKVETQSGVDINNATIGINGESLRYDFEGGSINLSSESGDITEDDIDRMIASVEDSHRLPNRQVLSVEPCNYSLDGQEHIRNPLGMRGFRLGCDMGFVSVLQSDYDSLCSSQSRIENISVLPNVIASASAVLTRGQRENGVCVIDMGAETTSMVVFEEGAMRALSVIPYGSHNITKDLAMMLMVVPEVAEEIKLKYATGIFDKNSEDDVVISVGKERLSFKRAEVDETIEARLDEIFDKVRQRLRAVGYDRRLPEGIILTGGGANMKNIERYVRSRMEVAVRVMKPGLDLDGDTPKEILSPEWACAVGLMFYNCDHGENVIAKGRANKKAKKKSGPGLFARFFSNLKV